MACVENIAPMNVDSEMEEGEIVDDLSDISSEEEFLLRQRLQVLENYNSVLERKKTKRSSFGAGKNHKKEEEPLYDLSEISATELEDYCTPHKNAKVQKHPKPRHKRKKSEPSEIIKNKNHKKLNSLRQSGKKKTSRLKRKLEVVKVISESSEESEDEYRNRRRRLADAVVVTVKNDKTSLSERLQKMFCQVNAVPIKSSINEDSTSNENKKTLCQSSRSPISQDDFILNLEIQEPTQNKQTDEIIDICTDEESKNVMSLISVDTVDSVTKCNEHENDINKVIDEVKVSNKDSDDDLELLRQHALKTKSNKTEAIQESKVLSEDEDSDTKELRLICLKSALLKKAIEMKRKQKLQKRISQSTNDDTFDHIIMTEKTDVDNNTDIESVDMDIGSDAEDKVKENDEDCIKDEDQNNTLKKDIPVIMVAKQDELEEDEDVLRAKLLISLSKNLPNLVTPNIIKSLESVKTSNGSVVSKQPQVRVILPEEKRFIINVESDSEGEHEATKNLTKMHMKLSEQVDFQQKLDIFLKSTRMEVEKTSVPTASKIVQNKEPIKKSEKFVAKAVNNLPKSEQIEYKNLVKRMAELQKIKEARQSVMNLNNRVSVPVKDTLKPRNVTFDATNLTTINGLEEKIKISRKKIAEESAKMLKLRDEGTKLSQRFKIVASELRNIKTAMALNKKQQASVQSYLTKMRLDHQILLKSSLTSGHSKPTAAPYSNHINSRLQKENNPKDNNPVTDKVIVKEHYKNPAMLKAIKIGITNDLKQTKPEVKAKPLETLQPLRLSVEVDTTNNTKVVTSIPREEDAEKMEMENAKERERVEDVPESNRHTSHPVVEKGGGIKEAIESCEPKIRDVDDYKSPLDAFGSTNWEGDPNAILCPFDVCGDCKDTDCIYLHTAPHNK